MGKESSSSKVYTEKTWYCHYCGDGPLSCKIIPSCPMCDHMRCTDCRTIKHSYSSHR